MKVSPSYVRATCRTQQEFVGIASSPIKNKKKMRYTGFSSMHAKMLYTRYHRARRARGRGGEEEEKNLDSTGHAAPRHQLFKGANSCLIRASYLVQ